MIISHTRRFIFLKPMKVAGTSLEIALSKFCGPRDVITPFGQTDEQKRRDLGYTGAQNYLIPLPEQSPKDWARLLLRGNRMKKYFSHAKASEIRPTLPASVWNDYLKISVVRNPFDYAVSRYFWEAKRGPLPAFSDWLTEYPEMLLENRRITHIDGACAADVMIRYERFNDDLAALSDRMGLGENLADVLKQIQTKTSSRPRDTGPAQMFADHPDSRKLVEILCHEDIETYGYQAP